MNLNFWKDFGLHTYVLRSVYYGNNRHVLSLHHFPMICGTFIDVNRLTFPVGTAHLSTRIDTCLGTPPLVLPSSKQNLLHWGWCDKDRATSFRAFEAAFTALFAEVTFFRDTNSLGGQKYLSNSKSKQHLTVFRDVSTLGKCCWILVELQAFIT